MAAIKVKWVLVDSNKIKFAFFNIIRDIFGRITLDNFATFIAHIQRFIFTVLDMLNIAFLYNL